MGLSRHLVITVALALTLAPASAVAQDDGFDFSPEEVEEPPRPGLLQLFVEHPELDLATFAVVGPAVDDNFELSARNSRTYTPVAPGEYAFSVDLADGWKIKDITCDDGDSVDPSFVSLQMEGGFARVEPGEFVSCVVDLEDGEVVVAIETLPRYDDQLFNMSVQGFGAAGADELLVRSGGSVSTVRPSGTWRSKPEFRNGNCCRWEIEEVACQDSQPDSPSSWQARPARADHGVSDGEVVTCTYSVRDNTVPREGYWTLRQTDKRTVCRGRTIKDTSRARPEVAIVLVGDEGSKINAETSQGKRTLRKKSQGVYQLKRGKARITWDVGDDTIMFGLDETKRKNGCTIVRHYRMEHDVDLE